MGTKMLTSAELAERWGYDLKYFQNRRTKLMRGVRTTRTTDGPRGRVAYLEADVVALEQRRPHLLHRRQAK